MARRPEAHRVAVVVFVTAEGADAHDAVNVAERAIQLGLVSIPGLTPDGQIPIEVGERGEQRLVAVRHVVELGRAARNHLIVPATSPDAYKP